MLIIDPVEQPECISFFLSRIEYDDFVPVTFVVLLIIGQQMVGAQYGYMDPIHKGTRMDAIYHRQC